MSLATENDLLGLDRASSPNHRDFIKFNVTAIAIDKPWANFLILQREYADCRRPGSLFRCHINDRGAFVAG